MYIESTLGDKGLYLVDCVDQEHLEKIFKLEKKLNSIKQLKYFRSSFKLSNDELSTYLTTNINAAIIEYLNKTNKNKSDYIAPDSYAMSHWIIGESLEAHTDNLKYDHPDTHSPRSIINALLYLTDDYEDGEIVFPEIDVAIRPKAGSVVVFDSDLQHGVNAVKSGLRVTASSNLYSIHAEDIDEIKALGYRYLV
jgi:predicted 2-oxoglutarate/Fe(II)-dependent dioxygenase YbiX